ncbi:prolyl hydroxylase family protein [Sphingomonas baiyangensis]|nr:2OG-Fe(II) oxygenase [Sphingomonas baiyangensis]
MTLEADFAAIARQQGPQAAARMVEQRAGSGDAQAMLVLAQWRLWGLHGPRLLAEGYRLASAAAAAGMVEAHTLHAALLATGTGTAADAGAADAAWRAAAAIDPAVAATLAIATSLAAAPLNAPRVLSVDPWIAIVPGLATEAAARHVIARAEPRLQPSFVVDPASGQRRPHPVRTSLGTNFAPSEEDAVLHALHRRIADATGTPIDAGEPLHVLAYAPGQEYRPHLDTLPGVANQRAVTAIVYLNADFEGGATRFGKLGLDVAPEAGSALLFRSLDAEGRADPRTEHAGLAVTAGRKWIATRWIRQRRCHPWEPETMR